MKKAQTSQIVIFALSTTIVVLIMIFGYLVIHELNKKKEETEITHFKTKLLNDIKTIKEGDVKLKSYIIPKDYREVCFVDDNPLDSDALWCSEFHETCHTFSDNEPELDNAIKSEINENVFLVGIDKIDSMFVGKIDLGEGQDPSTKGDVAYAVYCFEIKRAELKIKITGKGDYVLVQKSE